MLWNLLRYASEAVKEVMTIGVCDGPAFLIKNFEKMEGTFVCINCGSRLTAGRNLQRHASRCTREETKMRGPEEKLAAPLNSYSRWFQPPKSDGRVFSKSSKLWLEKEAEEREVDIPRCLCGHGGKCKIQEEYPVDGFAL